MEETNVLIFNEICNENNKRKDNNGFLNLANFESKIIEIEGALIEAFGDDKTIEALDNNSHQATETFPSQADVQNIIQFKTLMTYKKAEAENNENRLAA